MLKILSLSFMLAASLGCSSGVTASFHPSAPGGTPLSQLSSDQVHTICVEQIAYLSMLVGSPAGRETLCRSAGKDAANKALLQVGTLTDAALQQACQQAHDACLRNPPLIPDPGPNPPDCASTINLSVCFPTVDTYAACVTAESSAFVEPGPACGTLTVTTGQPVTVTPTPTATPSDGGVPNRFPPICQSLFANCPGLPAFVFLGMVM
jgi:hypothetical protein